TGSALPRAAPPAALLGEENSALAPGMREPPAVRGAPVPLMLVLRTTLFVLGTLRADLAPPEMTTPALRVTSCTRPCLTELESVSNEVVRGREGPTAKGTPLEGNCT